MEITLQDPASQREHSSSRSAKKAVVLYEEIFKNLPLPALIVNRTGTISHHNAAFLSLMTLRSGRRVLSANLHDFVILRDRDKVLSLCGRISRATKTSTRLDTELVAARKKTRPVQMAFQELTGHGKILVTITDKALLSQSHAELKQRTDILENLFYLISHNLKSPIVSIQGFTKLLLEGDAQSEYVHYLERIEKNAARMNSIVQDMLDFAKITRQSNSSTELPLFDILENVRAEFFPQIRKRNIEFKVARDLPVVRADHEGLSAIFRNLVENSIKYSCGSRRPKIQIDWQDKKRFYVFRVSDNGIGIPKKYHDKIFELFERAAAPLDIEGTGIGLALVKRMVEKYGGQVKVNSQVRKGTTIYFSLPKVDR